jgi:hypothetical protein
MPSRCLAPPLFSQKRGEGSALVFSQRARAVSEPTGVVQWLDARCCHEYGAAKFAWTECDHLARTELQLGVGPEKVRHIDR